MSARGKRKGSKRGQSGPKRGRWEDPEEAAAEAIAADAPPPSAAETTAAQTAAEISSGGSSISLVPDQPGFYAGQQALDEIMSGLVSGEEPPAGEASPVLDPLPQAVWDAQQKAARKRDRDKFLQTMKRQEAVEEAAAKRPRLLQQVPEDAWARVGAEERAYIQRQLNQGMRGRRQPRLPVDRRQEAVLATLRARMVAMKQIQAHERVIRMLGYSVQPVQAHQAVANAQRLSPAQYRQAMALAKEILDTANL